MKPVRYVHDDGGVEFTHTLSDTGLELKSVARGEGVVVTSRISWDTREKANANLHAACLDMEEALKSKIAEGDFTIDGKSATKIKRWGRWYMGLRVSAGPPIWLIPRPLVRFTDGTLSFGIGWIYRAYSVHISRKESR